MGTIIGIGMVKSWPYWQRILNAVIISVLSFPITIYFVSGLNVKESVTEYKTCLAHAEKIGLGSREYELITIK